MFWCHLSVELCSFCINAAMYMLKYVCKKFDRVIMTVLGGEQVFNWSCDSIDVQAIWVVNVRWRLFNLEALTNKRQQNILIYVSEVNAQSIFEVNSNIRLLVFRVWRKDWITVCSQTQVVDRPTLKYSLISHIASLEINFQKSETKMQFYLEGAELISELTKEEKL